MASLKQFETPKTYLEIATEFCTRHIRKFVVIIGITVSLLGLICLDISFKNISLKDIQVYVYAFVLIFFLVNLYFVFLDHRKKELPEILTRGKNAYTVLLLIIAFATFFLPKWFGHHNEYGSVLCLLFTVILCLVNYRLTMSYKNNWNMPHDLLNKLVRIEGLGLFIAVMQLFIAFPQLKAAYETLENNDINNLKESLETFNKHLESAVIVDIPDSLMNEDVAKARTYQKELYAYSLFLTHCNLVWDYPETDINIDSIISNSKYDEKTETIVRLTYVQSNFNARMAKITDALDRFNATNKCITNINKLISRIEDDYRKEDSLMSIVQTPKVLTIQQWNSIQNVDTLFNTVTKNIHCTINSCHQKQNYAKNASFKLQLEAIEESVKGTEAMENEFKRFLNSNEINNYITTCDKVCLQYIQLLNLIQLKYAYGVNYTGDISDSQY